MLLISVFEYDVITVFNVKNKILKDIVYLLLCLTSLTTFLSIEVTLHVFC